MTTDINSLAPAGSLATSTSGVGFSDSRRAEIEAAKKQALQFVPVVPGTVLSVPTGGSLPTGTISQQPQTPVPQTANVQTQLISSN